MKTYYQLYYHKGNKVIEISIMEKTFIFKNGIITDELYKYNEWYYFSKDIKVLRIKAAEIKQKWMDEAFKAYQLMQNIKIIDVYK